MKRASVVCGCLLVICMAGEAASQRPLLSSLQVGDTIKVWAVGPRLNGETVAHAGFQSDTLTLGVLPFNPTAMPRARVPYAMLRRIDVRRGAHRSKGRMFAGIALGAAGGLLVGPALGAALECAGNGCNDEFEGLGGFVIGTVVGFVGGGITGGVIGARPRARWESVDLRR